MIIIESSGDFKRTDRFLKKMARADFFRHVQTQARQGAAALASATPHDSGLTASSWGYQVKASRSSFEIVWTNSNIVNGFPVAIMLQYGHGTGRGGWVSGRNYINPALRPVFEDIANTVWKEVTSA